MTDQERIAQLGRIDQARKANEARTLAAIAAAQAARKPTRKTLPPYADDICPLCHTRCYGDCTASKQY